MSYVKLSLLEIDLLSNTSIRLSHRLPRPIIQVHLFLSLSLSLSLLKWKLIHYQPFPGKQFAETQ